MQDKDLLICMKASRLGLSMKEASAYFSIGYDIIEEIAEKYAIKFVCNRRRSNETRAEERRDRKNATAAALNDIPSREEGQKQLETTVGRTVSSGRDRSKEYIKKKFKTLIAGAKTQGEKYEIVYAYLMQKENEKKSKPNKPQAVSKTRQQEAVIKRRLIMLAIGRENLTAPEIVAKTDLEIHSITALLHKMGKQGIVNKERTKIRGKKNMVWSYSKVQRAGLSQ